MIFFVLSLAGLVATWVYNTRLTEQALAELQTIENDLQQTSTDIQAAEAELESAQAQIDIFQAVLDSIGLDAIENTQVLADVADRLDSTLSPLLGTVAGGINTVREGFLNLKEKIESLNDLPLVNIEVPGGDTLEEMAGTVEGLQNQVLEVKTKVENISELTQETVETLTTGFKNWEAMIQRNQAMLEVYQERITAYQEKVTYLQTNVPIWIDQASIVLTILLVWLGFSQLGLFILAWSFFKGQDLLGKWR